MFAEFIKNKNFMRTQFCKLQTHSDVLIDILFTNEASFIKI